MTAIRLDELSSVEFGKLVKKSPLVIIPVGAVEEHGRHLPLCTDSVQPEYIAEKVAEKLNGPVLIAPSIRYANCVSTRHFPGTLSLSYDTVRALFKDILSELVRNGIRKIIVMSGHAGAAHMVAMRDAGEAVTEACPDLTLMVLSDFDIAYELKGKEFDERDGHAGTIESSRVMAIKPKLVKRGGRASYDRPPKFMLTAHPELYFPDGYMGAPSKATAAQGRRINTYIINGLLEHIKKNFTTPRPPTLSQPKTQTPSKPQATPPEKK